MTPAAAHSSAPPLEPLRLVFVLPRFAEGLFGGAELLSRLLGQKLAEIGHHVEVLTTQAIDHFSWRNELPAGVEQIGLLKTIRFPVDDRDTAAFGELETAVQEGYELSELEEEIWMRNQVSSHAMEDHLASHKDEYDLVIPLPYLFGTTYFAFRTVPEKCTPIPCLHDEPYAYLKSTRKLLEGSRAIIFNSKAERELARNIAPRMPESAVVGLGFDPPGSIDESGFRAKYKIKKPFLLYVGRREAGKNVPLLVDYFVRYKRRRPGPLALALVGSGDTVIPTRDDIIEIDLDWKDRDSLYASAEVFCQPSLNESFSIVLMQAWQVGTPVIVHERSRVTLEHCRRSGGGLWFRNYATFEELLDRLLESATLRDALGDAGRRYVQTEYSWEAVLNRFQRSAQAWVNGART